MTIVRIDGWAAWGLGAEAGATQTGGSVCPAVVLNLRPIKAESGDSLTHRMYGHHTNKSD